MSKKMSDRLPDRMPGRMSGKKSNKMSVGGDHSKKAIYIFYRALMPGRTYCTSKMTPTIALLITLITLSPVGHKPRDQCITCDVTFWNPNVDPKTSALKCQTSIMRACPQLNLKAFSVASSNPNLPQHPELQKPKIHMRCLAKMCKTM